MLASTFLAIFMTPLFFVVISRLTTSRRKKKASVGDESLQVEGGH
ncbi:hypothetical protein [Pseudomonas phoenicis]